MSFCATFAADFVYSPTGFHVLGGKLATASEAVTLAFDVADRFQLYVVLLAGRSIALLAFYAFFERNSEIGSLWARYTTALARSSYSYSG